MRHQRQPDAASYTPGPPLEADHHTLSHFEDFTQCIRSRKVGDLCCEVLEGHIGDANLETETFMGYAEGNLQDKVCDYP